MLSRLNKPIQSLCTDMTENSVSGPDKLKNTFGALGNKMVSRFFTPYAYLPTSSFSNKMSKLIIKTTKCRHESLDQDYPRIWPTILCPALTTWKKTLSARWGTRWSRVFPRHIRGTAAASVSDWPRWIIDADIEDKTGYVGRHCRHYLHRAAHPFYMSAWRAAGRCLLSVSAFKEISWIFFFNTEIF